MDSTSSSAATTRPSTPRPTQTKEDKTAEFARLFYFFDKLTQPRTSDATAPVPQVASNTSADTEEWFPKDIAPLLEKLSSILAKDVPQGAEEELSESLAETSNTPITAVKPTFDIPSQPSTIRQVPSTPTRPRRNTVATPTHTAMPKTHARFPLGEKRYPFTFKMLLHKLYDLDGWATKVREVLAASQEQFRPLEASPPTSPASPGATFSEGFFAPLASPTADPDSPTAANRAHKRGRSASTSQKGKGYAQLGLGAPSQPQEAPRAVKKRIVNRRRSVSGPGSVKPDGWIYDAAVSSVDVEAQRKGMEERRRKRVFSSAGYDETEGRKVGLMDVTNAPVVRVSVKREAQVHFAETRPRKRSHFEQ
ncbi:hypothetical protein FA95DRAFT_1006909 [Auriscalpium vulgare]|uniref:Uncharacterized protein n=1 Tax=Auriscalpium vulgare TaxID=40419 RepID=A0ACB8RYR4_9AGAM|nr:hypothetical protein FA95DRAFT_1006909 [Auriscalpium vulgare]